MDLSEMKAHVRESKRLRQKRRRRRGREEARRRVSDQEEEDGDEGSQELGEGESHEEMEEEEGEGEEEGEEEEEEEEGEEEDDDDEGPVGGTESEGEMAEDGHRFKDSERLDQGTYTTHIYYTSDTPISCVCVHNRFKREQEERVWLVTGSQVSKCANF